MKFQSKQQFSDKNLVAPGADNKIHQIHVGGVADLDFGHVVVITKDGCQGRWDGAAIDTATTGPYRFGIVLRKQMFEDYSVVVLVKGNYIREEVVLADDSNLTAEQEFYMTERDLWAEGEW